MCTACVSKQFLPEQTDYAVPCCLKPDGRAVSMKKLLPVLTLLWLALLLRELGKAPLITAKLRLGEGSGAVAAMPLLDMALAVYRECYTFAEGGIEPYTPQ